MLRPDQIQDTYPLTPLQEGMLFHEREGASGLAYFEQFAFTIEGALDVDGFVASWNEVIRRHPALRTIFSFQKTARPMQLVLKEWEMSPDLLDWRTESPERLKAMVETLKRDDRERPFRLNQEPPSRWTIVLLPNQQSVILWSHHHIILDGWSGGIVLREVLDVYKHKLAGKACHWNAPPTFKAFVEWLEKSDKKAALDYWDEAFRGMDEIPQLPRTSGQTEGEGYTQETIGFELSGKSARDLERLAVTFEMTLGSLIQLLWGMVAARCAGSLNTAYLTIVSGRSPDLPGVEDSVGLFINPAPVVVCAEQDDSLRAFAERGYDAWLDSEPYQQVSLSDIQGQLGRERNFDHLFVFVNYPMEKMLAEFEDESLGFKLRDVDVFEHSNYGLELIVHPGEAIRFDFKFNSAVYSQEIVNGLAEALRVALQQAGAHPDAFVRDIELASVETRSRLRDRVRARAETQPTPSVFERFLEVAQQFSDRTALIAEGKETRYGELVLEVGRIATQLRDEHGIAAGKRVGICLRSGEEMVRAILGVVGAGGTYVPLDPDYPKERIQWMVEDSEMAVVIAEPESESLWQDVATPVCSFSSLLGSEGTVADLAALENRRKADDAAYVIYTSGSTGKPKGCAVSHHNLARLFDHEPFEFDFDETDVWVVAHSFCFDFSVWEMYGALLFGGALVLPSKHTNRNPDQMVNLVREHGITVLNQTPGAFLQFVQAHLDEPDGLPIGSLRWVIFGGDRLDPSRLRGWVNRYPLDRVRLVNMYGITETTVHVTFHQLTEADVGIGNGGRSPIGLPLKQMETYVCDPFLKLLPTGIPGEFYVGGDGVCHGYLNRPELTDERFLPSPLADGKRWYRTGDLGVWKADGRLDYIGRNDAQAQIRGFRVEMGEVEARVSEIPGVRGAVVMPVKAESGDDEAIAAYVTLDSRDGRAAEFVVETARGFLAERMPSYMIPGFFVVVDAFPLNRNGKIDRGALPDPKSVASGSSSDGVPQTEDERIICEVWADALELPEVGLRDNFFELGGHSLVATRIASRLFKRLGVSVPLRVFFEEATAEAVAREVARSRAVPDEPLVRVGEQDSYPLSNAQRRLWVADQMKGGEAAYNLATCYRISGPLRVDVLNQSIRWVCDRHESLRTSIRMIDGEPRQVVAPSGRFTLEVMDRTTAEQASDELELMGREPFRLDGDGLIRARLYPVADEEWLLCFCLHHIITDGWSLSRMAQEVSQAYLALGEGGEPELPALQIQYRDYSDWQRRLLDGGQLVQARQYWHDRFQSPPAGLELPYDRPRPVEKTYVGQNRRFELNASQLKALRLLGGRNGATLFMTLTAVVKVLLQRLSGSEDIVVGSPIAGRDHADLSDQLGCYLNTLALRTRVEGTASFREVLRNVRATVTDAFEHRAYPFDVLVDELSLNRDPGRAPLFDVLLGLQSQAPVRFELPGLGVDEVPVGTGTSKFDLTWSFEESDTGLGVHIEVNTDLWEVARAAEFFEQFQRVVAFVTSTPDAKLSELSLVDKSVREQMTSVWNPGETPYPSGSDLASLFEAQVARNRDAVAVWSAGQEIRYADLNDQANKLARSLKRSFEIRAGEHVGLCISRGVDAIVGILAILKLGAAYVPIDTSFPSDRAFFLAGDAGCRIILCDDKNAARLEGDALADGGVRCVRIESLDAAGMGELDATAPDSGRLAYIMYTSGSTGVPKGVAVEHRSVARLVCATNYIELRSEDRVLQLSNIAFDGSVFDIFGALLNGAALVLVDEQSGRDLSRLRELVIQSRANVSFMTTALLNQLADFDLELLGAFRVLLFGGQEASVEHIRRIIENPVRPRELIHVYGPTETTTFATYFPVSEVPPEMRRIPIGRAISNTSAYVLDDHFNLQAPGVPGDLYLGGPGLARGYWGREDQTQERYVERPSVPEARLYATGDRVLWNRDGQLEFLGRRDGQVKIRGYRIELGEIENVLQTHANSLRVSVVARSKAADGTKEIVAYLVPVERDRLNLEELRAFVGSRLPDYMIPAHFVELDELPMTPNGKVDIKALPEPEGRSLGGGQGGMAPVSEEEEVLLRLTQEILNRSEMGREDNYFSMGGDSIKAIQIASRLHEQGYRLEVKDIFLHQTVAELAAVLERVDGQASREAVTGSGELGPAQRWFYDLVEGREGYRHFNQSVRLRLMERVTLESLRTALQALVEHHDVLRCGFQTGPSGEVRQVYADATGSFSLDCVEASSESGAGFEERCLKAVEGIQASLNPDEGVLLGAVLIKGDEFDELVLAIHHLAVDTVSWRILAEDFETLLASGERMPALPAKTVSYLQWAGTLRETLKDRESQLEAEEAFWAERIPSDIPGLFSNALAAEPGLVGDEETVTRTLSAATTQRLQAHAASRPGLGMMALLLTAISRARAARGESTPLVCALEGHGRDSALVDSLEVSRTVGWFTDIYPVSISGTDANQGSFDRELSRVVEQVSAVRSREIPFVLTHRGRGARFAMSVNFLGESSSSTAGELLQRVEGPVGPVADPKLIRFHEVDLVAEIVDGQMQVSLAYSRNQYAESLIRDFFAAITDELEAAARVEAFDWGETGSAAEEFDVDFSDSELDALLDGVSTD